MTLPNAFHVPADGPAVYLPVVKRGTDFVRVISIYDAGGQPVDLRGNDARMYWRERAGGNIYFQLANGSGLTLGNGTLAIHATPGNLANVPIARPVFDLEMRWANGVIDEWFGGTAALIP